VGPYQGFGDQPSEHIGGGSIMPRRCVRVDLLRDTLVGVAEPIGDDLPVDAKVASERGICVANVVKPDTADSGQVD
jgi:hypothetical protein